MEEKIYTILEDNMPRLETKLNRIKNKCNKYGKDFSYEIIGEQFKKNSFNETNRFLLVKASGTAKIDSEWRFVARVEQEEKGNIFYGTDKSVAIPIRYRDSALTCEHCGNKRTKKVYIVYNETINEFKSVGKSCLCDFIAGLDADDIARYYSLFDELLKGEEPYTNIRPAVYYNLETALQYVIGLVNRYGYVRKSEDTLDYETTGCTSKRFFLYGENICNDLFKGEDKIFEQLTFKSEENLTKAKAMIEWIREQQSTTDYMHNLVTICSTDEFNEKNWNFMASLVPTYNRAMEKKKADEMKAAGYKKSEYFGAVGDRIKLTDVCVTLVTSYETMYGIICVYKIVDNTNGNIFIWKSSKGIGDTEKIHSISGTIKDHEDRGYGKQTILTRCKVVA